MGREPSQYKYIPVLKCGGTSITCCPFSLDQLITASAKSSSNIFYPFLCEVLFYSMDKTLSYLPMQITTIGLKTVFTVWGISWKEG